MDCKIMGLCIVVIGVLILVLTPSLQSISSLIVSQFDTGISISYDSQWNSTENPDIPTANSLVNFFEGLMYLLSLFMIFFGLFKFVNCLRD